MSLHDAFTALLLLVGGVSAVAVSPPTNVRVSCQNVTVLVRWDYSTEETQTIFRGNLHHGNCSFETTAHQYDMSNCIWKMEKAYLKVMYVTIAAIREGNQSKPEDSNTFSFNKLKTVHRKCSLDFPSVEIKVDRLMGTVSFENPLYFYKELKPVNTDAARFVFTVSPAGEEPMQGNVKASCTTETTCKCNVSFHKGVEKCVTLTGMLFYGIGTEQVEFRKTHKICDASKPIEFSEMMLAGILLSIIFLAIVVIIICICMVQAWTMKTIKPIPKSLRTHEGEQPLVHKDPVRPDISSVHICDPHQSFPVSAEDTNHICDPHQSFPVSAEDTNHICDPQDSSAGYDCEFASCDRNSTDDDSADDSVKTECVSCEEEVSPYDCPQFMRLDMGDGDMVTGYTGN